MVPPSSHGISRAPRYFGYRSSTFVFTYRILTFFDQPSHAVRLTIIVLNAVLNTERIAPLGLASVSYTHLIAGHFELTAVIVERVTIAFDIEIQEIFFLLRRLNLFIDFGRINNIGLHASIRKKHIVVKNCFLFL